MAHAQTEAKDDNEPDDEPAEDTNDETPTTRDLRVVKEPGSEKSEAIVEATLQYPDATNGEIADVVESKIGERPDESWVSRVRRDHLEEVDDTDDTIMAASEAMSSGSIVDDTDTPEAVVDKVARLERQLDGAASEEDVDRLIDAVDSLAGAIDALTNEVIDIKDRIDSLETLFGDELSDQMVASLLRKKADDMEKRSRGDLVEA